MSTHTISVQEGESIVAQIVKSVASIHNTQPNELPPLEETIDTDLLQSITELRLNEAVNTGEVTFDYEGVSIAVHANGELHINYR